MRSRCDRIQEVVQVRASRSPEHFEARLRGSVGGAEASAQEPLVSRIQACERAAEERHLHVTERLRELGESVLVLAAAAAESVERAGAGEGVGKGDADARLRHVERRCEAVAGATAALKDAFLATREILQDVKRSGRIPRVGCPNSPTSAQSLFSPEGAFRRSLIAFL